MSSPKLFVAARKNSKRSLQYRRSIPNTMEQDKRRRAIVMHERKEIKENEQFGN